jgi:multidrug efflux system membrane fusion protein
VRLRANFPNQDNALFPNQFVYARLPLQQNRGAVLIPTAAVQRSANGAYVFLVKADGTASTQKVELGTTSGDESKSQKVWRRAMKSYRRAWINWPTAPR